MMSRALILAAILAAALAAGAARADEPSGCGAFKWDVSADQTALANAAQQPARDSGPLVPGATRLRLKPIGEIAFSPAPERPPAPASYGGVFALDLPPGLYRLSLSDAAWVDVVADGAALRPLAFSGARDCPHLRKALKFRLAGGARLQISGAAGEIIALAIAPD